MSPVCGLESDSSGLESDLSPARLGHSPSPWIQIRLESTHRTRVHSKPQHQLSPRIESTDSSRTRVLILDSFSSPELCCNLLASSMVWVFEYGLGLQYPSKVLSIDCITYLLSVRDRRLHLWLVGGVRSIRPAINTLTEFGQIERGVSHSAKIPRS